MDFSLLVRHRRSLIFRLKEKRKKIKHFFLINEKTEQKQMSCKCNFTECISFVRHHLPFISFNLVKSRSKLSTSASPAVRLASSWMSRSVIASEKINTGQRGETHKWLSLFHWWLNKVRGNASVSCSCALTNNCAFLWVCFGAIFWMTGLLCVCALSWQAGRLQGKKKKNWQMENSNTEDTT